MSEHDDRSGDDREMTNAGTEPAHRDAATPETDVLESDANGNGPEGLAGDMGLSSERSGPMRGNDRPGTHGAERTGPEAPGDPASQKPEGHDPSAGVPPEQSADPATGEPHPDNALPEHRFDPRTTPGHSHG